MSITDRRLYNQQLLETKCQAAQEVVRWLAGVQAQEYAHAKWGLRLRLPETTDDVIEEACNNGSILRTHMMRPTWHFVAAEDIRWIQSLTKDRVHTFNGFMYRKEELDETVLRRGVEVFTSVLQGGKALTRTELSTALLQAGIATKGQRLAYIVMYAELEAVICSGPRRGKQFTYMLVEERAPHAKVLPREEALAELTRRFFTSHGPATIHDFSWWSGLTIGEVKAGIELVKAHLVSEEIDGKTYWRVPLQTDERTAPPQAFLLPPYDEFTIAYKNHDTILDSQYTQEVMARAWGFPGSAVYNGQIIGSWRRTIHKNKVVIELAPLRPFSAEEQEAFSPQAQLFGKFLGVQAELRFVEA